MTREENSNAIVSNIPYKNRPIDLNKIVYFRFENKNTPRIVKNSFKMWTLRRSIFFLNSSIFQVTELYHNIGILHAEKL